MTETLNLTSGARWQSQACTTSIIVIRPGTRPLSLRCGGAPMAPHGTESASSDSPVPPFDTGTQVGKRYTHPDDNTLELLVTSPGTGALSDGETVLVLKESKALPSSD